jgi:hypothetical protein
MGNLTSALPCPMVLFITVADLLLDVESSTQRKAQ